MPSRAEVAKRWREIGERLDKKPPTSLTGTACVTLFELLGSAEIRDNNSYSDVFNRLADLIDPTCMVAYVKGKTICCDCGNDEVFDDYLYCPRCGARLMRYDL